jgi:hypothetical protein
MCFPWWFPVVLSCSAMIAGPGTARKRQQVPRLDSTVYRASGRMPEGDDVVRIVINVGRIFDEGEDRYSNAI